MNRISINKIYFKKFIKNEKEYILIEKEKDIRNIIKNKFENPFEILFNLRKSNRIV